MNPQNISQWDLTEINDEMVPDSVLGSKKKSANSRLKKQVIFTT